MLKKGDYDLPLEKQLRLRVIINEIDECEDREQLKENLKQCAESLMKYQHVCAKLAEENLKGFMNDILTTMGIELVEKTDA